MTSAEELRDIARRLSDVAAKAYLPEIATPFQRLGDAARQIGRSFSGSWLGYPSCVYYEGFESPPPDASFNPEWGLEGDAFSGFGSRGAWKKYRPEDVKAAIYELAHSPDLAFAHVAAKSGNLAFDEGRSEAISILEVELAEGSDAFLVALKGRLETSEALTGFEIAKRWSPRGHVITSDSLALTQGSKVPPHLKILTELESINLSFQICQHVADMILKAASHLERKSRRKMVEGRIGTKVFIGHGRSPAWRELKDFVQDRLALPWDEFNRVPIAGKANVGRLSEMLDAAAIALLVMTAEDEMAGGERQARMNVVHEAGLFQGRLGFSKAIVLLEEGCERFSNIDGLGHIAFPKGQINAAFEKVRAVLEREGVLT
jgi:predicted nucleotide-binding protein